MCEKYVYEVSYSIARLVQSSGRFDVNPNKIDDYLSIKKFSLRYIPRFENILWAENYHVGKKKVAKFYLRDIRLIGINVEDKSCSLEWCCIS